MKFDEFLTTLMAPMICNRQTVNINARYDEFKYHAAQYAGYPIGCEVCEKALTINSISSEDPVR